MRTFEMFWHGAISFKQVVKHAQLLESGEFFCVKRHFRDLWSTLTNGESALHRCGLFQ